VHELHLDGADDSAYEEPLTRTPMLVRPRADASFRALYESNRSGITCAIACPPTRSTRAGAFLLGGR
jgi:hypothetical protein